MNLIRLSRTCIVGFEDRGSEQIKIFEAEDYIYVNPDSIAYLERGSEMRRLRVDGELTDKRVTDILLTSRDQITVAEPPEEIMQKISEVVASSNVGSRW